MLVPFAFESFRGEVANAFAEPIYIRLAAARASLHRRGFEVFGIFRPNGARNLRLWQVILVWILAMDLLIMAVWKLERAPRLEAGGSISVLKPENFHQRVSHSVPRSPQDRGVRAGIERSDDGGFLIIRRR